MLANGLRRLKGIASFTFSRLPRRDDPLAAIVVQKNVDDFAQAMGATSVFPALPRRDDPHAAMIVQENVRILADEVITSPPFFFPYKPRREDPFAALIVQKNLEAVVKAA